MASFTDQVPQFTPYVSQLPVDAMVKVGMEKQKRYEEGVQKIQTYIDNVAGLDILRDVDKNYLQSKLNQLGGNLTALAGADFSNFQLVNSVSGMANQIVKDQNVQAAVQSTAWYRKQLAEMEKARTEGKSSVQNQWDFNELGNEYIMSTDLGRKFTGVYTPFNDVKKKALETIKGLHPKLQQYDIPFEVVDGKINTKKIADAMQRYKIEGVDENQIKEAIYATLSPDDLNQLRIDARYQFRGVTSDQLIERAKTNYTSLKADAISSLDLLKKQKITTTDPNVISQIDNSIEYYERLIGSTGKTGLLDEQLQTNLTNAVNDPDGVKLSIYKDGFVKELANGFSWKNQVMEYLTNPLKQQENWVADMNFKQQVENRMRYQFSVEQANKEKELGLKAEEIALKKIELYGIDSPWTTVGNPTDNVLRSKEIFTDHVNSVNGKIDSDMGALMGQGYSKDEVNMMVNKYEKDPVNSKIPANAIKTVQSILKNKNYLLSLQDKQKELQAQAEAEVRNNPKYKQAYADADAMLESVNGGKPINIAPGVSMSAKEIADKLLNNEAYMVYTGTGMGTIGYVDRKTNKTIQIPLYENGVNVGLTPGSRYNNFQKVLQYVNKKKEIHTEVDNAYKQKLAPIALSFVPQIKALGADKDGSPTPITVSQLSALITARTLQGAAADNNWNAETASDMLSSEKAKDTRVFVYQNGDNYEVWMKNEKDPSNIQKIRLSQGEIAQYFGANYVNPRTQESYRVSAGKGNTNINSKPERAIMQKQFGDFPGIRNYNITADLQADASDPSLYIPMVNIMKSNGRYQTFPIAGDNSLSRLGFEQGRNQLNSLTDETLMKLLKEHYPSYDFSQLETRK